MQIKEDAPAPAPVPEPIKILSSLTIEGIADYINSGKCNNIIVMTGAGVSVAAGIPDFRFVLDSVRILIVISEPKELVCIIIYKNITSRIRRLCSRLSMLPFPFVTN